MKEHVDLQGASGATYRFRLVADPAQLPATSGNAVYVRWRGDAAQVAFCGAFNSLTSATLLWSAAVRAHGVEGLYIRLNVARAVRDQEHEDLVQRTRPPMTPHLDV